MPETSYTSRPAGSPVSGAGDTATDSTEYWPLDRLRKAYTDYLFSKREEIDEQIDARRYYHGSQWTDKQIKVLTERKQPIMTFNRVSRKIDGVVGLIERLRQDPKAYPRTPQHEQGAELATAVVRYVLDEQNWTAKSPQAAQDGAVDGIGGIELELTQGDHGDPEIGFDLVDIPSFFYDPLSYQMAFDDARYMGVGKWLDVDIAQEMFPDAPENAFSADNELVNENDREARWFRAEGTTKRVRIIDIWYKHNGGWCWAIFSGHSILMEGKSYLRDQKGKDFCKYIMFSGSCDQDGDRYGFVRNLKSAQDGINAKQSKMQFMIASKRLFIRKGMVDNVEKTRAEYNRHDGIVEINGPLGDSVKADDQTFDFVGLGKLLELNITEIDNFGPNPQLIGEADGAKSGRAIALLQQAGMAELGPYISAVKGWKLRVYRAVFNAVQGNWKAERWIRVTDDDGLAQFVKVNGVDVDPQTGHPAIVNAIGSLDVDIIMDEGPDTINSQADNYETMQVMASQGLPIPPQALIELAPLASSVKKRVNEILEQAQQQNPQIDPAVAKMKEVEQNGQIKAAQLQQDGQIKAAQLEMNGALKTKELEQDAYFQQQKLNQDMAAQQHKMAAEMTMKREQHDNDMHMSMQKHTLDREASIQKMSAESEIRAKDTEATCAPIKQIAAELGSAIGGDIKEGIIEGLRGVAEVVARPRQVNVIRDKSGRVIGGQSS